MRETIKNIEDLINAFENTGDNGNFFIGDYSNVEIAIYIRKQREEIEKLNNRIEKAKHFIDQVLGYHLNDYKQLDKDVNELYGILIGVDKE